MSHATQFETITLGGGCFWCVEAVYQLVEGVHSVKSGYAGDSAETANYQLVSAGSTNHAEVVQIQFDPNIITLAEILDIFWSTHDPTTLNRQGNDIGPQYRSVIFYENETQKQVAEHSKQVVASPVWDDPIVTEISPLEKFYPAEIYHDNYYQKVGSRNPYCSFVITPKVTKLRKKFADKLKDSGR